MQPDTYAFDDQPLIHEGIWKAASAIANAPMQMAQIRMQQEDRSQAQEDRRTALADRDRAFGAAQAEREYQHGKDATALKGAKQKQFHDIVNRLENAATAQLKEDVKSNVPNPGRPTREDILQRAKAEYESVYGEAAPGSPSQANQSSAPQGGSDADVLRASLKALGGSPTYTPSPLRTNSMDAGSTAMPSRFGQAVQGLPQENEWTGKPMPQIAQSGAAPTAPHRIVMGVDVDEPAGVPYQPGSAMERGMLYDNSMIDTGATNFDLAPQNAVVDGRWAGASGGSGGGTVADMNPPTRSTILNVADNVEGLPPPPITTAPQIQNGRIPNQFNDSIPQFGTTMRPKIRMFDPISQQAYDVDAPLPAAPPARAGRGPLRMMQ